MNIIELALLAYLGLFLILAKDFQLQTATSTQLDAASADSCGKAVPTISTEWIVFGVLYFLPVTVLLLLVGRWLSSRGLQVLRFVYIIIGGMQAFISYIYNYASISNCTKLYIYTYIILCGEYVWGDMLCVEELSFFHSTPMCKDLQLLHIHSYICFSCCTNQEQVVHKGRWCGRIATVWPT